jgi:hypothetical protein
VSITKETTIWCDGILENGDRCYNWEQGIELAGKLRALIRKERGWVRREGRDLCGSCAREEIRRDA